MRPSLMQRLLHSAVPTDRPTAHRASASRRLGPARRLGGRGLTFAPIAAALLGSLWLATSGDEARQQDAEPWRHPNVETTLVDLLPAPAVAAPAPLDTPAPAVATPSLGPNATP